MDIAAGQGQTTTGDKILMSTETSCHFAHLLQVSKNSLSSLILYNIFFMILYMYIAPGQSLTTPWGWNFNVNRNILSLRSFVAHFKRISLKSDFIHFFFSWLIHVYSTRAGADSPQGTKFWCQQKCLHFIHLLQVSKNCLWSLILYNFLYDLIHVYSHGAGLDNPRGQNFDVNRKALSFYPFVASFKEISLKSDFIHFFSWFNTCI